MIDALRNAVDAARSIQVEVDQLVGPPENGRESQTEKVVLKSLVRKTRGYIEKIANQANGAYESGWYDAAAVMLRRLLETLIIECFEAHSVQSKIQDDHGNYMFLRDLIGKMLAETSWQLGRNTKTALAKLKDLGDKSAHSRRFIAQRGDIDPLLGDIRTVVQELLIISRITR